MSKRDATGRWTSGTALLQRAAVEREREAWLRGSMRDIWTDNAELTTALNVRANELLGNIASEHALYTELRAEALEYARGECMLAAVDRYILALQERVIDKKRRRLHQIMHDRRALAEQLGTQRTRIANLKNAVDMEARLKAVEARLRLDALEGTNVR